MNESTWNKCYYTINTFDKIVIGDFLTGNDFVFSFLGNSQHCNEFQAIIFINIYKFLATPTSSLNENTENIQSYPFVSFSQQLILQQSQMQQIKSERHSTSSVILFSLILSNLYCHYLKDELTNFGVYDRSFFPNFMQFIDVSLLEQNVTQVRFIKFFKKHTHAIKRIMSDAYLLTKEMEGYMLE